MPLFDIYTFADYSGAKAKREQRTHIVLAVYDTTMNQPKIVTTAGLTRRDLLESAKTLLRQATDEQKRVIIGFDHSYSFPLGFYEAVTQQPLTNWDELVSFLADTLSTCYDEADNDIVPRNWAAAMNQQIAHNRKQQAGPFWGANFTYAQKKPTNDQFSFTDTMMQERRLVEEQDKRMKTAYQLGGNGAVGLQMLFGIYHLAELIRYCREERIPLHCWPFDGWHVPEQGHVLAEVYPTAYLSTDVGKRTDAGDAIACVEWVRDQDASGRLEALLSQPTFSQEEWERVRLEGWVLGI